MKGRGNTDTKTGITASRTTQRGTKHGVDGTSSRAQDSTISRLLFRLNKEAWDPKALNWSERVLARDLQLTLWQPHLPREAGGRLWYLAGLILNSHLPPPRIALPFTPLAYWFSPAHPCTLNTTGSMSGWGRHVLSQNSFQAGKPGVHTHSPQGTHCTAIIRPSPLSQEVIPAGRGWGVIRQRTRHQPWSVF